jgi:hypothetical protein
VIELKNDSKRLRRRELQEKQVKRLLLYIQSNWGALHNDGNRNRIQHPRWFDYIGTEYHYRFKTQFSHQPSHDKTAYRYVKVRQYLREQVTVEETNDSLQTELGIRLYTNIKRARIFKQ